jgi:hypothetical protein
MTRIKLSGQLNIPLKTAVSDLQPITITTFFQAPISAYALDTKMPAGDRRPDILWPHSGKLQLDKPTLRSTVDVG